MIWTSNKDISDFLVHLGFSLSLFCAIESFFSLLCENNAALFIRKWVAWLK